MKTKQDFWYKVDYEGGIGGALFYFCGDLYEEGYDLPPAFIQDWATAYDAINRLQDQLNEWEEEFDPEI